MKHKKTKNTIFDINYVKCEREKDFSLFSLFVVPRRANLSRDWKGTYGAIAGRNQEGDGQSSLHWRSSLINFTTTICNGEHKMEYISLLRISCMLFSRVLRKQSLPVARFSNCTFDGGERLRIPEQLGGGQHPIRLKDIQGASNLKPYSWPDLHVRGSYLSRTSPHVAVMAVGVHPSCRNDLLGFFCFRTHSFQ